MSVSKVQPLIINTRPVRQAEALTKLLQKNDYEVVELPLIEIKDNVSDVNLHQLRTQIEKADLLIFISANAVIFYFKHFSLVASSQEEKGNSILNNTSVAVIGKSTAEVFAQYAGRKADIIPDSGSDSESLLVQPCLNQLISQQGNKTNILIVRGQGGREFLAKQLRLKNAIVDYLEVYRRECPIYDESFLHNLWPCNGSNRWNSKAIGFMIITSGESLDNLLQLTKKIEPSLILETNLLVIHKKIQKKSIQYGFSGRILVSKNASNPSIIQTLLQADG
ncbi:MAG: uroporphyrinogen-III synthase [Pseudomonadota bacterium]